MTVFNLVKFFYMYGSKYNVIEILGGLGDIDISKRNRMVSSISCKKLVMKNHPFSPIPLKKIQFFC